MIASSRSRRGEPDARTMFLLLACLLTVTAAAPTYDQRQDGDYNVGVDLQNIVIIVGLPKKLPYGTLLDFFTRSSKSGNDNIQAQDRADTHVMKAFVEPSTPYRVDIDSESVRSASGDGGSENDGEVIIAGRRRLETEPQHQEDEIKEPQHQGDEMKLIGATEQCGPDRERDPVTLICRFRADAARNETPKVVVPAV